MSMFLTEYESV